MSTRRSVALVLLIAGIISGSADRATAQTKVDAEVNLGFWLHTPGSPETTARARCNAKLANLLAADVGRPWTLGGELWQADGIFEILADDCAEQTTAVDTTAILTWNAEKSNVLCGINFRGRSETQVVYPWWAGPGPSNESGTDLQKRLCPDEDPPIVAEGGTENPPGSGSGDGSSPILIDLDRGGFRLTDFAGGVSFDLAPGGVVERIAWTDGGGDGFLALDRDGDGLIEDGGELFGNFTPQPPSEAPNGYAALALYDQAAEGGDGDGWISAADAVFGRLRLWIDSSHDGYSDATELHTLPSLGVSAISLRAVRSRRRDRHGNEVRYVSLVRLGRVNTQAADVFLVGR